MTTTPARQILTAHGPTLEAVPPRVVVHTDQQLDRTGVSRSAWRTGRQLVTIAVFALATTAGVHIGLQGPAVSPVARTTAPVVAAAPAAAGTTTGTTPGPNAVASSGTTAGPTGAGAASTDTGAGTSTTTQNPPTTD